MVMRVLGLLFLALLLAGCGEKEVCCAPEPQQQSPTTPEAGASPIVPKPGGDTLEGQPPVDGPLPDTRTGAVPLRPTEDCLVSYSPEEASSQELAFDGTVTDISDGTRAHVDVTFEVSEVFSGEPTEEVRLRVPPPTVSGRTDAAPSYFVGTRLLVSAVDGFARSCGFTRYFDEDTAAAWRSG